MKMMLPDNRFQSPTAVPGKGALRDEYLYSSVRIANGGSGQTTAFLTPKGSAIPGLGTPTVAYPHQTTYTQLTTNFSKAGEPGSALGDLAIRAIGITFEQAACAPNTGLANPYGATQFEVAETLAKCFLEFKVGGKKQIEAPLFGFPAMGGPSGSISTSGNAATAAVVNNGFMGVGGKRLRLPIPVGRTDTVEANIGVAGGSTLAFNAVSGATAGQPFLIWIMLSAIVKGDAR